MQAIISYPVSDVLYELTPDYKDIKNKEIINDNEYYTGAEIKYWFFANNINLDKYYTDLRHYIELDGKCKLNDYELYKIIYSMRYKSGRIFSKKQIQEY